MDNLFMNVVADARGNVLSTASGELRQLIEAIKETGKKGSITLTLAITPEDGDNDAISIDTTIKVTAPKRPNPKSIFFIDKDNGLSRQDPRQAEMFAERQRQGVASLQDRRTGVPGDMIAAG